MRIGGLRVESDRGWMSRLAGEQRLRLHCFKDLKHLFVILTGLLEHENDGKLLQEVENLLQEIANTNTSWKVPPWTIVENEAKAA